MDEKELLLQLKEARRKCEDLKTQSVEANRELDGIETQIVDYLESKQASSTAKYDGIGYVTIEKPKLHASCNKENREQLVLYLVNYLRSNGYAEMVIETVGNKSLNTFVKECIEKGMEIPEYVNHYFERVVKLYE